MSKRRTGFEPQPRDLFSTPPKAVDAVLPYLHRDRIRKVAEPCAGLLAITSKLEDEGFTITYSGDIALGQDALATRDYGACDAIVTNPPFDTRNGRKLMHDLILHFQDIAPTWLLIDMDWCSSIVAAQYLPQCVEIAPLGRVKWFADSKFSSTDNFGWYHFDARHSGGPILRGRTKPEGDR